MKKLVPFLLTIAFVTVVPLTAAQGGEEVRQDILEKDGSKITFYGRVFATGTGNPQPMNTQFPAGEEDFSIGTFSSGCNFPPDGPDAGSGDNCVASRLFWYTTAGFIQTKSYEEVCPGAGNCDYSQWHNERGQTKDIYLDTSMPVNATLHMSADGHPWLVLLCGPTVCWNWDPGYFPDWTVEMWVWHASLGDWSQSPSDRPDMGPIASRGEEATLVAHGQSEPRDMWSLDPTIPHPECDGECHTVHAFGADLEWDPDFVASGGVVPYESDLIVEFQAYQQHENGNRYIMPGMTWNTNSGEDYPNNIVLPVRNPLDVELVFPRFVHEKLVILSIINTPWGSYDIDPELTRLIITGPSGNEVQIDPATLDASVDASVAHAGHYKPINATWVWDYQAQGLAPGEYTATVEVTNFQHSFTTSTDAFFTISAAGEGGQATAGRSGIASYTDEDFEAFQEGAGIRDGGSDQNKNVSPSDHDDQESPGFAVIVLLAALGAVAALRRWRA